jgi:hypothetical protein
VSPDITLADAARNAAAKFLQSVVVVDDQAALTSNAGPDDDMAVPPGRDNAAAAPEPAPLVPAPERVVSLGGEEAGEETTSEAVPHGELRVPEKVPDVHGLDAKSLIARFAEMGLVCAVLKPDADEDLKPQIAQAAKRADLIVLDWEIYKDGGLTALGLIDRILSDDEAGRRLRLIAIYTVEPALKDIADKASAKLDAHYAAMNLKRLDDFTIIKGPARVVVLAKQGTRIPKEDHEATARIIDVKYLPDRLVEEFSQMTMGLLPKAALVALAALRADTHKLLTIFDRELDAAYLGHRILLPNPRAAEGH